MQSWEVRHDDTAQTADLGQAKRVKLEVAGGALALDGLEESNATEDLGEGGPQENLGHASRLDQRIMGVDRGNLSDTNPE